MSTSSHGGEEQASGWIHTLLRQAEALHSEEDHAWRHAYGLAQGVGLALRNERWPPFPTNEGSAFRALVAQEEARREGGGEVASGGGSDRLEADPPEAPQGEPESEATGGLPPSQEKSVQQLIRGYLGRAVHMGRDDLAWRHAYGIAQGFAVVFPSVEWPRFPSQQGSRFRSLEAEVAQAEASPGRLASSARRSSKTPRGALTWYRPPVDHRGPKPRWAGGTPEKVALPPRIGRFEVVRSLGQGGMGRVYLARSADKSPVAIKVLHPRYESNTIVRTRFRREAQAISRIDHPAVVRIVETGEQAGVGIYFAMEYVEGTRLSELVAAEQPLALPTALRLMVQVCRGVQAAHNEGVVHRDLKPDNVLLREDGSVVVIDFGLSRDLLGIDPGITDSHIWLGTPAYIAPEQLKGGANDADPRADVYSLGAILYELLGGKPPHGLGRAHEILESVLHSAPTPIRELRPEMSPRLEQVCMQALAAHREDRVPSAGELGDALEELLVDLV